VPCCILNEVNVNHLIVAAESVPRHRFQVNELRILGDRKSRGGRIVGGRDVTIEQHPYQIGLFFNRRHTCGGF
jgi:hypothetical protein